MLSKLFLKRANLIETQYLLHATKDLTNHNITQLSKKIVTIEKKIINTIELEQKAIDYRLNKLGLNRWYITISPY